MANAENGAAPKDAMAITRPPLCLSPLALLALAGLLVACSPSADKEPAQPTPKVQKVEREPAHQAFIDSCMRGGGVTLDGEPGSAAECHAALLKAQKSEEAAGLFLAVFRPDGAAHAASLGEIRARLPQIIWTDATTGGSTIASGHYDDFDVVVTRRDGRQWLGVNWIGSAGEVPYNLVSALALHAQMQLVGCYNSGTEEKGRAWRVQPEQGESFYVVNYSRVGPSGTAQSSLSASAPLDQQPVTLESLRASDPDWVGCS